MWFVIPSFPSICFGCFLSSPFSYNNRIKKLSWTLCGGGVTLVAPLFDLGVDLKILLVILLIVRAMGLKEVVVCNLDLQKKKRVLVSFFDSRVEFKVFVSNITRLLKSWLQKVAILTSEKNSATNSVTFNWEEVFGVSDKNIAF